MNWKKLFLFDLGRMVPGLRKRRPLDPERRLWFDALRYAIRRGPAIKPLPKEGDYRPSGGLSRRGLRWRGPFYLSSRVHRRNLLSVMGQILAIVSANAPLSEGLRAAAMEQNRVSALRRGRNWVSLILAGLAGAAVFALLAVPSISVLEKGDALACAVFAGIACVAVLAAQIVLWRGRRQERVFLQISELVALGASLSEAMGRMDRFFPHFFADMVKAGEESGKLRPCLEEVTDETLYAVALGYKTRGNFYYLGLVFAVQALLISFISLKILPVFIEIISEYGGQAPGPLRFWIWLCDSVTDLSNLGAVCAVGLLVLVLFLVLRAKSARFSFRRGAVAGFLIPGLRGLVVRSNLAAVAMMLGKLLEAGVPIDTALRSVADSAIHPFYKILLSRVHRHVLQGETLAASFDKEAITVPVPKTFRSLVAVGEQSGMVPQALGQIVELYRRDVEKRARLMSDAIMPFGVLCLGFITLIVELAVFGVMIGLADSIV